MTSPGRCLVIGLVVCAVGGRACLGSDAAAGAGKHGFQNCGSTVTSGPPAAQPITDPLPASLVAQFSVLRRASGAEDQLPPLNPLGELGGLELGRYYTSGIRLLATETGGTRFYLIVGFRRSPPLVPLACLTKGLSPRQRRRRVAEYNHLQMLAKQPVYCVAGLGASSATTFQCNDLSTIATGFAITQAGQPPQATMVGLVPDGVSSVVVTYPPVVSTPAANNFFASPDPTATARQATQKRIERILRRSTGRRGKVHLDRAKRRRLRRLERNVLKLALPQSIDWLGPNGQLLKHFTPPKAPGGIYVVG